MMLEEVYDYLHDYGFRAIDIDEIENRNENIYFATVKDIKKIFTFLEDKYLEHEDIIEMIHHNPFLLTERNNRLEALDEIYNGELGIDYVSLVDFLKANPKAYTISPLELQKSIRYMMLHGCEMKDIREFILKNPNVVNMKLEVLKERLTFR